MKRLLSIFFVFCTGMSARAQQLDFTNYYLNYGKHIHDFSSSEQEGETGESESGQAGKSYEYMFDRMHTLMELEVSSDSIARNYSELEALFETNNDISESSMLYEIYRAQGKFEEASTVYEAYLRDTLSADENALNDLIFEISNAGGYALADSIQQQALQSLLNSEESIRMQVKSALELMTKEPFECEFDYPEIPKSKVTRMEEKPTSISLLEVYPNPVSEDFTVGFVLPSDQRNSALNIYNNLGQLIDQIDLSKDNGIHYLNARNWQSGLYILDLIVNGKVVESKSIVVKH